MAKSKQEEALQFLDDLDSLSPAPGASKPAPSTSGPGNEGEAADVLAFLDEITQKSAEPTRSTATHLDRPLSRAGTPTIRKSTERLRVGATGSPLTSSASPILSATSNSAQRSKPEQLQQTSSTESAGGWGWGTVWSSASAAIQQAKSAVDEQVKHLPKNEQARKWGEGVIEYAKTAQLEKIGMDFKRVGLSTLTDILNVVAPPISEHEVIQVWLSHDMRGYDGIESLVYRALARIMEQVEGGDLVVNRGEESRPKETGEGRDLNAVEGYEAAFKLAQANLDEVISHNSKPTPQPTASSPTTYSQIYLRVQPFMSSFTLPQQNTTPPDGETKPTPITQSNLQFILHLADPGHQLVHTTITQAVPGNWVELWDQYDWVEDLVAEALRVGVEVIGQEYVVSRMGWGNKEKPISQVADGDAQAVEQKS